MSVDSRLWSSYTSRTSIAPTPAARRMTVAGVTSPWPSNPAVRTTPRNGAAKPWLPRLPRPDAGREHGAGHRVTAVGGGKLSGAHVRRHRPRRDHPRVRAPRAGRVEGAGHLGRRRRVAESDGLDVALGVSGGLGGGFSPTRPAATR